MLCNILAHPRGKIFPSMPREAKVAGVSFLEEVTCELDFGEEMDPNKGFFRK